jgi:GTPase
MATQPHRTVPTRIHRPTTVVPLPEQCDSVEAQAQEAQARLTLRSGMLRECGERLEAEDDAGAVEYKWRLVNVGEVRLQHLMTQMQFRVGEGEGECIYEIGVEDDGLPRGLGAQDFDSSIATLRSMADRLGFTMTVLFERVVSTEPYLRCAEIRVRNTRQHVRPVRVAVVGDAGAGKSTLTGVLTDGDLDNGQGSARQAVFNHRHELQTGETSSVSRRLLGFDGAGDIINYGDDVQKKRAADDGNKYVADAAELTDRLLVERSKSLVALLDLPGQSRRMQTTWSALLGRRPHCGCVVMNALNPTPAEHHMRLFAAIDLPFFVILTNQDRLTSPLVLAELVARIDGTVRRLAPGKRAHMASLRATPLSTPKKGFQPARGGMGMPKCSSFDFFCADDDDAAATAAVDDCFMDLSPNSEGAKHGALFPADVPPESDLANAATLLSQVPIFVVSCVTGHGVDPLRRFLSRLSIAPEFTSSVMAPKVADCSGHDRVLLHDLIVREGMTIALGTVVSGSVTSGGALAIGPVGARGDFLPVTVESIQIERIFSAAAVAGDDAAFALDGPGADVDMLLDGGCAKKRGLVLVNAACREDIAPAVQATVRIAAVLDNTPEHKEWGRLRANQEMIMLADNARLRIRIDAIEGGTATVSWPTAAPVALAHGRHGALFTPSGLVVPVRIESTVSLAEWESRNAAPTGEAQLRLLASSPDSTHAPSANGSASHSSDTRAAARQVASATMPVRGDLATEGRRPRRGEKRKNAHRAQAAEAP